MTPLSDYEAAVQSLVSRGWTRTVAERQVRTQLPHLAPPETTSDDRALEVARRGYGAYGIEPIRDAMSLEAS